MTIHDIRLPYGRQSINDADVAAVADAARQPIITRGEATMRFEQALAARCGAEYAVSFNSGSSALMAAAFAADITAADRVISTPNTYIATVGVARQRGATPVFVDIDRSSGNMDLEEAEEAVNSPATRGKTIVMPVHFAGIAVDMARLEYSVADPRTVIIEDAAHALGSEYPEGGMVGSCQSSDMTIFSFHPVKTITTGEGGAVMTNRADLYEKLLRFRGNGIQRFPETPWYYEATALTGNFHMTDMQAALGLSQLSRLDEFVAKRRSLVLRYRERLQDAVRLFSADHDARTAYHLFVVQIPDLQRTAVMEQLASKGIGSQYHYVPVYRHPAIHAGDIAEYFPEMEAYFASALSLPLFYDMTTDDVDYVAEALLEILKKTPK